MRVLMLVPGTTGDVAAAVVVHHAGAGMTAAGLRAGIPSVPNWLRRA
jgi:UDP:flavonoid glycosyltransferase YjiC (YdhE family)